MISREEGFDLQIKQRVLTKIRGTEMMVGPLLSEEAKRGDLSTSFAISTFEHSLAYIRENVENWSCMDMQNEGRYETKIVDTNETLPFVLKLIIGNEGKEIIFY